MWDTICSGQVWHGEIANRRQDGSLYVEEMTITPLQSATGEITHFIAIKQDITERKRTEEQIRTSLREKEVMLQEIHHRVKNNLQIISSLLDMQSWTVEDPVTRQILQDSQNRVRSMASIHEKLYQSPDLTSIDVAGYVYSVVAYLRQVYNTRGEDITLDIQVDEVSLDLDMAIPCGLIINELVSNALKYAFPPEEKEGGEIRVVLRSAGDGQLSLVVSDDGVGLAPDVDLDAPKTLGLRLVDMLTQQLNGTLELDRNGGLAFEIRFPDGGRKSS